MTREEEFRRYMKAANRTSGPLDDRHLSPVTILAYCRGELSEAEHEAAQAHLVACEPCLALFRNARDFLESAGTGEDEVTPAETNEAWQSLLKRVNLEGGKTDDDAKSTTVRPVDFQRPRDQKFLSERRISLAMAAGLVLSIAGLGWLGWRLWQERQVREQSQEVARNLDSKQRELEQRLSQLEKSGSDQVEREREQRRAAEAERDHLQDLLAQAQPSRASVPLFTFRLSSERGTEDNLPLNFNRGVQAVRLRLFVSKPYEFPEYALELIDQSGKVVREISNVRPAGNEGALNARLNRAALTAGTYKLRLFGQQGRARKQLGEYGLAVTMGR